jgi:hypothetical protein
MLKTLLVTTAVSGLIVSGAFAQTPPASPPDRSPPAKTEPAKPPVMPEAQKPAAPSPDSRAATTDGAKNMVITEQKPDQWLFSRFKGTDVVGPNNEKIGDVNDILFDKEGKVHALIIGVGGFLGIGQKEVALGVASFDVVRADNDEQKLRLSMSKEQLQQAAEFKPYNPPRPAATQRTPGSPGAPGTPPAPRN